MLFKHPSETIIPLVTPTPKLVGNWIWMIDINSSHLVQAYGKKMIATHFGSKEAAEHFIHSNTNSSAEVI